MLDHSVRRAHTLSHGGLNARTRARTARPPTRTHAPARTHRSHMRCCYANGDARIHALARTDDRASSAWAVGLGRRPRPTPPAGAVGGLERASLQLGGHARCLHGYAMHSADTTGTGARVRRTGAPRGARVGRAAQRTPGMQRARRARATAHAACDVHLSCSVRVAGILRLCNGTTVRPQQTSTRQVTAL
jgi:hypothetical protein